MYAVIETGGKQYRVREGETLAVERLDADPDESVTLRPVLLVSDDGSIAATPDALASAQVSATVLDQGRGDKLTVMTYKNKTGYRRKQGHRQHLTRIRVDEISA